MQIILSSHASFNRSCTSDQLCLLRPQTTLTLAKEVIEF